MKVINANLNEGGSKPDKIKIIPISDVHLGDELCNLKLFRETIKQIAEEPNTYTILNGDLCNMALKNSKSDVYSASLTPMEQILQITEFLEPIKDKILVMSSGNHEDRTAKETNIDVLRLVARELGIEDKYANGWWYLYLSFGENRKSTHKAPVCYTITGYHGSGGGGRKSGGKINRLEEMSSVVLADLYIMGHTHKPIITKGVMYSPFYQSRTLMKHEMYYLMTNSFLEYEGGYAEKMGMMPSNTGITEAELSGKIKKIRLSM